MIPCFIRHPQIEKYIWFQNPIYNNTTKEYEGKVVFNSSYESPENRVQRLEEKLDNCTILIRNVQEEDTGTYGLRLWLSNEKWMERNLSILVSDIGPDFKIEQKDVRLKENQQVTLVCSVNYYCPEYQVNLSWTGITDNDAKAVVSVDTKNLQTTNKLTFKPSWKDHNQTIRCILSRPSSEAESRNITLNVEYAPEGVHIWPNNSLLVIRKPEKVTLECRVNSSNPPVKYFRWYETFSRSEKLLGAKDKTFIIDRAGNFKCEATNDVSKSMSKAISVFVQFPPESVKIIKPPWSINEGDRVILECSAKAIPDPTKYIWYKNEKRDSDHTTKHYNFERITEDHAGSYQCEVYNALGQSKSESLHLDVKYKPKNPEVILDPEGTSFTEGQIVTFLCLTNRSNPPVLKTEWRKNEKVIDISKPLKLAPKDSGSYKCSVENEVGSTVSKSIPITVLYRPNQVTAEIVNSDKIKEGEKISLKCTASPSEPKVSGYAWYKDGDLYPQTSQAIEFQSIKWTDSGDYACEAQHVVGNVKSQTVNVNVQYAPRQVAISVDPSQWVTEHSRVAMTCNAKANPGRPMTYEWYRNNVSLRMYSGVATLSIIKIQTAEEGHYYCTAKNQVGIGRSNTVYLRVSYSAFTIGKYTSTGLGVLLAIILLVLAIRFKIWRKLQRNPTDDISDSSFFVLKKSHNELLDGGVRQSPSVHSSVEHLDYSTIIFQASNERETQGPRKGRNSQDPGVIYSVVRKPHGEMHEYENVKSANNDQEEIHYSTIVNRAKGGAVRQNDLSVEYATLKC
ncbi:B-cell receptor CD22-like [Spea bombifrons]|uniref:B-cell receptor CD22-like n=1 Tax=Spea bombifrons TaxID=233779 RepID=UPI00234BC7BC|nr:B-cell receptor CD22-like [Spea bombifrons]